MKLENLSLEGLSFSAPQVLGGVRLVPLVRDTFREDLRLSRRAYGEDVALVSVNPKITYMGYVPHGLVANWTNDGSAVFGTQFETAKTHRDGKSFNGWITARGLLRMARREHRNQLRFLPLHVAMEGFLASHFGGPSIAWTEYSKQVKRSGLSPRVEAVLPGRAIVGLEDALRLFEIHHNQVGLLLFVADSLASVFVVPHPEDYKALHHTLISDFYGDLIWHHGLFATENEVHPTPIDSSNIATLKDLRREIDQLRLRWADLSTSMAPSLFERKLNQHRVYRFKPFSLKRFITDLDPNEENFIGEMILSDDGALQYLKTYRLSAAQTRRAYLLKMLAATDWNLDACATLLACRKSELVMRLEKAGFGYLLHQHVLDSARSKERKF
ncbi:MAG: hypothetical protein KDB03_04650 [Planctomycetales bacterium]|nr:hypothetical protein [Planctomycetales bacterium]